MSSENDLLINTTQDSQMSSENDLLINTTHRILKGHQKMIC